MQEAVKKLQGTDAELARVGLTSSQISTAAEKAAAAVPAAAAAAAAYATSHTPALVSTLVVEGGATGKRTLTLMVESELLSGVSESCRVLRKKCVVKVSTVSELHTRLQEVVGVAAPIIASVWDADFQEWSLVTTIDDFETDKAKVKVAMAAE